MIIAGFLPVFGNDIRQILSQTTNAHESHNCLRATGNKKRAKYSVQV